MFKAFYFAFGFNFFNLLKSNWVSFQIGCTKSRRGSLSQLMPSDFLSFYSVLKLSIFDFTKTPKVPKGKAGENSWSSLLPVFTPYARKVVRV
jgi:hypothetical protein